MKIIERLLLLFNWRAALRIGAVQQPTDLIDFIYEVRARSYQRITGKSLPRRSLKIGKTERPDLDKHQGSSLARRLGRKD